MPQLDTAPWLVTILGTLITLYIILQLKTKNFTFQMEPSTKTTEYTNPQTPWELKWTKISLPLSLPLTY